jgi:hypothetical protein
MTQVTNVGEDEKWQAIRGAKKFSSGQQWFEVVISRQAHTANTVRFSLFRVLQTASAIAAGLSHARALLPSTYLFDTLPFPILILNSKLSASIIVLRRRYAVEILHWRLPRGVRLQPPEKVDWLAGLVGLYFRHRRRVSRRRDQVPCVGERNNNGHQVRKNQQLFASTNEIQYISLTSSLYSFFLLFLLYFFLLSLARSFVLSSLSVSLYSLSHHHHSIAYGAVLGENDVLRVLLDFDEGTISFARNGVCYGVAFTNLRQPVFPSVSFTGKVHTDSVVRRRQQHMIWQTYLKSSIFVT